MLIQEKEHLLREMCSVTPLTAQLKQEIARLKEELWYATTDGGSANRCLTAR